MLVGEAAPIVSRSAVTGGPVTGGPVISGASDPVGGSAMASLADTRAALMPSKSSPIIPVNLNLDLRQSTSHTRVIEIRPMGGKPPSRPMSAFRHMEQVAPWVAEGIAPPSAADPTWHMAS